jgi:hypothetical protein
VSEGRGLSDLVQEIPDGFFNKLDRGMEPLTWKVLAKELEVSHQGLHLWRQLEDAPATADLEAWKAFKAERCLGRVRATGELNSLKADLLREQIRQVRAKNQREAGELIAAEVVDDMLVTLAQKLDLLLRLKLEVELGPRVAGKSMAEANVEGALIVDEIREVINANIATFETTLVPPTRTA